MLRMVSEPFDGPVAVALIEQVQLEYVVRYSGRDETPVDPSEFAPPNGDFLIAYAAQPVGCGGWRSHGAGVAELKRMYVVPQARGTGVGRALLQALEESARQAGRTRMVLESGSAQPEALGLYRGAGYDAIEPFGTYACAPGSRHLGRDLTGGLSCHAAGESREAADGSRNAVGDLRGRRK